MAGCDQYRTGWSIFFFLFGTVGDLQCKEEFPDNAYEKCLPRQNPVPASLTAVEFALGCKRWF